MDQTQTAEIARLGYHAEYGWTSPLPALNSERTLVVVFGASDHEKLTPGLEDLRAAYPDACMLGCSTAGEIHGDTVADDGLTVAIMRFVHTDLVLASAPISGPKDSHRAGVHLAEQLRLADLRAVFVLSDGLHVNGSELVHGLKQELPPSVRISGGLAGDGDRFERTWVLRNGRPTENFVVAVGFRGDRVRFTCASEGGWDVFGPERRVSRAEGNVLFELDGKPALPLYKEYLGDQAAELPASALLFPLAVRPTEDDEPIVRTILGIDEESQSLTFAGDIPHGGLAQLMHASHDRLIDSAAASVRSTTEGSSCLAIAISCVGRRLVLGARSEEELESTQRALPDGSHQVGFYSYGEISPAGNGCARLHNQTMTMTTIAEV